MMMFGYQHELQYLSAGNFQALVEMVVAVNGLESGMLSPSLMIMNGLRLNDLGLEFGVGPIFRISKMAKGYYDSSDAWIKTDELPTGVKNIQLIEQLDYRGSVKASTGMILAFGKTFTSGYLNVPVNLYFSPRKEGSVFGLSFGFNVSRSRHPMVE